MEREEVLALIGRDVTPGLYNEVRALWKTHSVAEDNRDIHGIMQTLTEDCVYELPQTGDKWEGHIGATQFYTLLLAAFPDIEFRLQNIVIGPQGVYEEARATATHIGDWLDFPASGNPVEFTVVIFFPYDIDARKFSGERIHFQFAT
jgi:predicted ester cyclase